MPENLTEAEARLAISSIERHRQQVIAEINVPPWYWSGLAAGWVGLGVLADEAPAWAVTAGTLLFGAAHAAIAPRVLSGRNGSPRLSVRSDLVSRRLPALIIGFLMIMTIATVGAALIFNADGARHPASLAGAVIAAVVACGGPNLMSWVRRRAERNPR